jgi:tetratricopeptide (TPR) repeat protein
LQNKYGKRGVAVVGITHEALSAVQPFVAGMGDKMDYAVAADNKSQTTRAYMDAFGVEGIPHAFLVDRSGALVWHGYPQDADEVLDQVLAGRSDSTEKRGVETPDEATTAYVKLVRQWDSATSDEERERIAEQARQTGEAILRNAAHNPDTLYSLSWEIMMLKGTRYRDLDLAGRAAQAAYEAGEHKPEDRIHKQIHDYFRTAQSVKRNQIPDADSKSKLSKYAEGILRSNDPAVLSNFARLLLVAPDLSYRDLDLALRAAEAANTGSKGQDPSILNTYALALFKNDKRAQALELTERALALTQDERMRQYLRKSLELYQHADTAAPVE